MDALILKAGMNPVMQGSCYVMHPEALQAVVDEAIKQTRSAPVQEPVAFFYPGQGFYWAKPTKIIAPVTVDVKPLPLYTAPPAQPVTEESSATQPAVPDAIIEAGERPEFRDGWNECRETMLQMLKARTT